MPVWVQNCWTWRFHPYQTAGIHSVIIKTFYKLMLLNKREDFRYLKLFKGIILLIYLFALVSYTRVVAINYKVWTEYTKLLLHDTREDKEGWRLYRVYPPFTLMYQRLQYYANKYKYWIVHTNKTQVIHSHCENKN